MVKKSLLEITVEAIGFTCLVGGAFLGLVTIIARQEVIKEKLENLQLKMHEEKILGEEDKPEKFYEIDGKRVYLEIDGKPVEEYFKGE